MADQRDHGIAWTETTWNPVRGCSRVSEGCRNCYAERVAARFSGPGQAYEGLARMLPRDPVMEDRGRVPTGYARWTGKVVMVPERLTDPLRWKRPRRVFVNSMSDLFHEALSDEQIDQVFAVMALAGRHTFQVLTKRAERMRDYLSGERREEIEYAIATLAAKWGAHAQAEALGGTWFPGQYGDEGRCELAPCFEEVRILWPLPNVWLGVSVEDQKTADERIPHLIGTPAAVRWVSYEPALGPVDFRAKCEQCSGLGRVYGPTWQEKDSWQCRKCDGSGRASRMAALDWLVVGGESGPGARRFEMDWARSAVKQCKAADVACFMKQLGSNPWCGSCASKLVCWCLDHLANVTGKGGDPAQWADDLRVREYPATP